jgi:hypothetical protein
LIHRSEGVPEACPQRAGPAGITTEHAKTPTLAFASVRRTAQIPQRQVSPGVPDTEAPDPGLAHKSPPHRQNRQCCRPLDALNPLGGFVANTDTIEHCQTAQQIAKHFTNTAVT